jgi:hypothetical protein
MKISLTRFSVVFVIALQWIAAIVMVLLSRKCESIFKDFNATLPDMSVIVLQATQSIVLLPIAAITTAIVVAAEVLLKSTTSRFMIQIAALFLWFAFTCLCVVALGLPLISLCQKLQ